MCIQRPLLHQNRNTVASLCSMMFPVQRQQPAPFIHGFTQDLAVGYAVASQPVSNPAARRKRAKWPSISSQ